MQLGVKQANGGANSASHEKVMSSNSLSQTDQTHRGTELWKEAGYITSSESRNRQLASFYTLKGTSTSHVLPKGIRLNAAS